jgi:hypothetical protein
MSKDAKDGRQAGAAAGAGTGGEGSRQQGGDPRDPAQTLDKLRAEAEANERARYQAARRPTCTNPACTFPRLCLDCAEGMQTREAAGARAGDAAAAIAKPAAQLEAKPETLKCPRCAGVNCPAMRGTYSNPRGITRYRQCGSCGHRFQTFQAHNQLREELRG